jgi:hypothetical protein
MIWLPKPLHAAKPFVYLLAALSLLLIPQNVFVTLCACVVTGHCARVPVVRLRRDAAWQLADMAQQCALKVVFKAALKAVGRYCVRHDLKFERD